MPKEDPAYEVEYIPAKPDAVTSTSTWFVSPCADRDEACGLEKKFHDIGWVARVVAVKTERVYLG